MSHQNPNFRITCLKFNLDIKLIWSSELEKGKKKKNCIQLSFVWKNP